MSKDKTDVRGRPQEPPPAGVDRWSNRGQEEYWKAQFPVGQVHGHSATPGGGGEQVDSEAIERFAAQGPAVLDPLHKLLRDLQQVRPKAGDFPHAHQLVAEVIGDGGPTSSTGVVPAITRALQEIVGKLEQIFDDASTTAKRYAQTEESSTSTARRLDSGFGQGTGNGQVSDLPFGQVAGGSGVSPVQAAVAGHLAAGSPASPDIAALALLSMSGARAPGPQPALAAPLEPFAAPLEPREALQPRVGAHTATYIVDPNAVRADPATPTTGEPREALQPRVGAHTATYIVDPNAVRADPATS